MERIIGYHCAPALAGIKPSNIVACYKDRFESIHEEIERLNLQLNERDIFIEPLCDCENRVLLMVYRSKELLKTLNGSEINRFMQSCGYPEKVDIKDYLDILKERLGCKKDFPHEIGAFLGYPIHDIYGFIFDSKDGCLLCGEWKVYKHPEQAKLLFARFAACRKAVAKRILMGQTLAQVFCASKC